MKIVLLNIILGVIIGFIAHRKGRSFVLWWLYGTLLPPAALPHLLNLPKMNTKSEPDESTKRCEYCDELIQKKAVICKHCKSKLSPEIDIINK